ncbi:MAG: SEC-C metal-binding domain-containing protein, partial [Saccharofermentanales bacterium]
IEHDAISRQIESAQKRVEAWNFNIRKNVLEYDQVLNRQREAIYSLRRGFLLGGQSRQTIDSMIENTVKNLVEYATVDTEQVAQWPWDSILSSFRELIGTYDQGVRDLAAKLQQSHKNSSTRDALEDIVQQFTDEVKKAMAQREEEIGKALFQEISRVVTLRNVDQAWMDHLDNMDDLKEGIGLRAYGQMNPLIEYQKESSRLFEATLMRIEEETIRLLFHLRLANEEEVKRAEAREKAKLSALQSNRNAAEAQAAPVQAKKEPGRNDPCPCGSGKKYKKCCGK